MKIILTVLVFVARSDLESECICISDVSTFAFFDDFSLEAGLPTRLQVESQLY